ncbi:hypothetical protein CWI36_0199p0020 [Hamiltosporidium magnivora]|uniref:T-cell immunomodulatory protein TIP C2 domain-containing protein n=3 Tax=Hamiltosporidium TaxID=1176354 RepID=A0A4Q9LKV7_9MICR|nr:hypothetical protein CWI36_0199p0020 [Hamiltosporidium magnivora]
MLSKMKDKLKNVFKTTSNSAFGIPYTICEDFILLAYGDVENKRKTDFIGTSLDKRTMMVYSYCRNSNTYKKILQSEVFDDEIEHIIPADFDMSGKISFLLIFRTGILYRNKILFQEKAINNLPNTERIPILFADLELQPCLLVQINKEIKLLHKITKENFKIEKFLEIEDLSLSHSSSFVDVDGDLKADLIFVTNENDNNKIVIFTNSNMNYERSPNEILIGKTGPIVFGNFVGDGSNDIAYISEENKNWYLNILINKKLKFCSNKNKEKCIDWQENIGTKATDWGFEKDSEYHIRIPLKRFYKDLIPITFLKEIGNIPGGITVTDLNMDGRPDLILTFFDKKLNSNVFRILENTGEFGENLFRPVTYETFLYKMKGILSVSSADPENIGTEGLVINREYDGTYILEYSRNYLGSGNLKLSAITILPETSKKAYGSAIPGVTYFFELYETSDIRIMTQMSQSSFLHLQHPAVFFGLGTLNLLVDEIFISLPMTSSYKNIYSIDNKIIPNSDLVLKPENTKIAVELFLNLTKYAIYTSIVVIIVLIINILLVYIFYRSELKYFDKIKKSEKYAFYFEAL